MTISIKKMVDDSEIEGKAFVHWKAWQETYPGMIDQDYLDNLSLEKIRETSYAYPENILVAKDGNQVIGFISYGQYRDKELPDTGEIYALYILKKYYGKGIGEQLMQEALRKLQSYPQVALWVIKDNERAINFYKKCGYQPDYHEKKIQLGSLVTECRMLLKQLSSPNDNSLNKE